jgi:hypothetical protein
MRSSPHPKPPTGYPREAVGDLMGLKGKMVGGPFWKPQKTYWNSQRNGRGHSLKIVENLMGTRRK